MPRHFCHVCSIDGDNFPSNADGPVCPECGGSFVEEIPADGADADDPRDFDPDDGPPLGGFLFGNAPPGAQPGQGGPTLFRFAAPGGGGGFVAGAGGAGGLGGGLNPLTAAMLQAFGLAPPPQGVRANVPLRGQQSGQGRRRGDLAGEGEDSAEGAEDGGQAPGGQQNQVPIQNLASFLGEAFGVHAPHPADDPEHNPFAEGSHERVHRGEGNDDGDERQQQQPGAGPRGGPLNLLGTLLNAFGFQGGAFGLPASAGDYAWGSEESFQQLLNDLMEQAAGRAGPQPAPDDMIEKLPRIKVNQEILDMDGINSCSVCQDAFQLDEAALSLPCRHIYHEGCIVPWLKTSGTCPTCRFALVPQPGQPGYGEQQQPQQPGAEGQASQPGSATSTSATAEFGGPPSASSQPHASTSSSAARPRPPLVTRQSSLNPHSPATARIPEVDGGSRLPGSWVWPDGEGEGGPRSADDDPEDMPLEEGEQRGAGEAESKDPATAAAEAAERRARESRRAGAQDGDTAMQDPIIEDVD
ncbi:uncharacterized protein JCM10292_001949 [Rhodotorula paludigena]|uniref:uncharacterized protein n=1 Tax=Rhodotorula paludigena TaxID=86838 RepID=UPI0031743E3D